MASLTYRPAIDGLRGIAVLSVFIFHLNRSLLPGGFIGVDVFFVISGYLITSIILKDCLNGSFSLAGFYQRRIARIFPAFFTVALATLAAAAFIYSPQDFASAGANLSAATLSVANLKFMLQGNYFELSPDAQPYLHYWSLSVEEQFYIFYPLLFAILFRYARRHLLGVLGVLTAGSLVACAVLSRFRPDWAFYLLPTRAWELLAGCVLAVLVLEDRVPAWPSLRWASPVGLGLIAVSLVLVHEGPQFPGIWPLLPVTGAVAVLLPVHSGIRLGEKWLEIPLLVLIGRLSYSLYLWHWPIFSLVDYRMCLASELTRLILKVVLSLSAAALSFWLVENPARTRLNRPGNFWLAYGALLCTLAICVPLGISVRRANYVNAEFSDVSNGGLVFGSGRKPVSIILMGDSNGSMYGKELKEICGELGYRLVVLSAAAGDPLPHSDHTLSPLWADSLAVVRVEHPDVLVLACAWESKLRKDRERLAVAVDELSPLVGRLVILNQPPILPANANRVSLRTGKRPPFYEDPALRLARSETNQYLQQFTGANRSVIDIASFVEMTDGEVRYLDGAGRQLYHDPGHLSGFGADLIRPVLKQAIESR